MLNDPCTGHWRSYVFIANPEFKGSLSRFCFPIWPCMHLVAMQMSMECTDLKMSCRPHLDSNLTSPPTSPLQCRRLEQLEEVQVMIDCDRMSG